MTVLRFDEAVDKAVGLLIAHRGDLPQGSLFIIRDLYGRLRLAFEGGQEKLEKSRRKFLASFLKHWKEELRSYAPDTEQGTVFWRDEMLDPGAVFDSPDKRELNSDGPIYLLDRQGTGMDWQRTPENELDMPVIAFYGLKGGVGRSTALAALAYWLGERGKRILVLDLDLESPGVGETLLPSDTRPDYGIVDWLIEDAVGQADASLIRDMSSASPISNIGDIRVVPAYGNKTKDYLPKLARAYSDTKSQTGLEHFGSRLRRLVKQLITEHNPDVVLLDSRAGLHDIAAAIITHLANLALLFATDSRQTWEGYRLLFSHWQLLPEATLGPIREKLRVVASMIPEEGGDAYEERLRDRSWDAFLSHLYDEITETGDGEQADELDKFSFDLNDESGPHFPLRIFRHRAYVEFDPFVDPSLFGAEKLSQAFGEFVNKASALAGIPYED